jgi:hypothetical protein
MDKCFMVLYATFWPQRYRSRNAKKKQTNKQTNKQTKNQTNQNNLLRTMGV